MRIHQATYVGHVHYTVADLPRQIAFYQDIIGMEVLASDGVTASMGTRGREILRLTEVKGARKERGTTGLYHTAFLVPERLHLARLIQRLIETQTPVQGTSDHGTHLAVYLPDPEGNGIELAWDYPKQQWPKTGEDVAFFEGPRRGVDVDALLTELHEHEKATKNGDTPSRNTGVVMTVGHVHLHVADLTTTRHFYNDILGFDITANAHAMGALFLSAGGYHHHIGANVWKGEGAPPPGKDATGLRYFSVVLPSRDEFLRMQPSLTPYVQGDPRDVIAGETPRESMWLADPSQNGVLITYEGA